MSIELKSSVGEKASNMPKFGTKIQTIKYLSYLTALTKPEKIHFLFGSQSH